MTSTVRKLALEPHPRAAQLARAFLAEQLETDSETVEIAQLLVSELVTNAVVHAASALEVTVVSDEAGLTVSVRDADTGPLTMGARPQSELDEGGRGFLLIASLSTAWGTEHRGGRKTVWFRLGPRPVEDLAAEPTAAAARSGSAARQANRRLRTLLLRPVLQRALSFEQQLGELVARSVDALGAAGAVVNAASGEPLVARGQTEGKVTRSVTLTLDERTFGELVAYFDVEPDDEDEAFLTVAAERLALLASEHGISHAERERAASLDYLSEATEILASSLSVSLSLTLVAQIVVPRIGDWCAIYSVDEHGAARRVTTNHKMEDRIDALNEALTREREVTEAVDNVAAGHPALRLPATVPVAEQRTAVVVAPLVSRGRTLGVMVVGRHEPLDAVGFMALLELGRRAALAVDNARLHEEQVATARALQTSLLPPALPTIEGVELAARYHSASPGMSVGGDFYDAFRLTDGSFVIGIGDVCGKGAEAASVTGMTRDLLRVLMQDGHGLAGALRRLNRALLDNASSSRFCTVALAQARRERDVLTVDVCLAGHPEPVILRGDGSTETAGVIGDLLGVMPDDLDVTEARVQLAVGDSLVLYTDGITERRDGTRMFGQFGLRRALEAALDSTTEGLAAEIEGAARTFVDADLRDDLAVLVMRCVAESAAISDAALTRSS